jgi:hypothetical protein
LCSLLLFTFFIFLLLFFLEIKLENVIDLGLFSNSDILFALHESILGVLSENLACGCFELSDNDFCGHYLINQVPHRHLNDLDASQNVGPANAVDHELIDLLCTTFKESSIVLAVVVGLVFLVSTFHLFALAHFNIGILSFVLVLIQCGQQPDHTLEQEQDVVETMDFEFFEKGSSQVLLICVLLDKGTFLIESFQVFNNTDLFTVVDLFIVFEKFGDNFLKYALLLSVIRLWNKRICFSFLLLLFTPIIRQRLIVEDLFEYLELILLIGSTISLIFGRIDSNRGLNCRKNVISLA